MIFFLRMFTCCSQENTKPPFEQSCVLGQFHLSALNLVFFTYLCPSMFLRETVLVLLFFFLLRPTLRKSQKLFHTTEVISDTKLEYFSWEYLNVTNTQITLVIEHRFSVTGWRMSILGYSGMFSFYLLETLKSFHTRELLHF